MTPILWILTVILIAKLIKLFDENLY